MSVFDRLKTTTNRIVAAFRSSDAPPPTSEYATDGFAVPHILTFPSLYQTWAKTYLFDQSDEARRRDRRKAQAMYQDLMIQGLLQERCNPLLNMPWQITSDDPRDPVQQQVVAGLTRMVKKTPNWGWFIRHIQRRLWYGRYGVNLSWHWKPMRVPLCSGIKDEVREEMVRCLCVKNHGPINGDKISFTFDGTPVVLVNATEAGLLPNANVVSTERGMAMKMSGSYRERILVAKHDPEDADYWEPHAAGAVHGVGIRSRMFWVDSLRRDFLSWVIDLMERIGAGIPIVKYSGGNAEAKREALRTAKQLSRRTVITMPVFGDNRLNSGGVEVLEAPAQTIAVIQSLVQWIEGQIERFVVGQSMSGGVDHDNTAGLGGASWVDMAKDSKMGILAADANEAAEAITGNDVDPGILTIMKKYTYPWAGYFDCRFEFNMLENGLEKLEAGIKMAQAGLPVRTDELYAVSPFSMPHPNDHKLGFSQEEQMMMQAQAAQQQALAASMGLPRGAKDESPPELTADDLQALYGSAAQPVDGPAEEEIAKGDVARMYAVDQGMTEGELLEAIR